MKVKKHTEFIVFPVSITELERCWGKERTKQILGEYPPQNYTPEDKIGSYIGLEAVPSELLSMYQRWEKRGSFDPLFHTIQTSAFTMEMTQKFHNSLQTQSELQKIKDLHGTDAEKISELQAQADRVPDLEREERLTKLLYDENKKKLDEARKHGSRMNQLAIRYRNRYGLKHLGRLNWLQRWIAKLFWII